MLLLGAQSRELELSAMKEEELIHRYDAADASAKVEFNCWPVVGIVLRRVAPIHL